MHFELVVVGNNHPAFARGHQLAGLKTECTRHAECSNPLSSPLTCMRMRAILDQRKALAAGDHFQPIEVRWMTSHMYRDDRLCFGIDCVFDQIGIDAVSVRIDIDQHGKGVGE